MRGEDSAVKAMDVPRSETKQPCRTNSMKMYHLHGLAKKKKKKRAGLVINIRYLLRTRAANHLNGD